MIQVGKFNVRIVGTNDKYGRNDCLTNTGAPLVEFYDTRYMHTPRGQFVQRYSVDTIAQGSYPYGLSLYGSEPGWTLTADEMRQVKTYLGVAA